MIGSHFIILQQQQQLHNHSTLKNAMTNRQ